MTKEKINKVPKTIWEEEQELKELAKISASNHVDAKPIKYLVK